MEEEYGFDLLLRYGVHWCFLLMMRFRVKVEIVDLWLEFGFGLMSDLKASGATFVKEKVEKKK